MLGHQLFTIQFPYYPDGTPYEATVIYKQLGDKNQFEIFPANRVDFARFTVTCLDDHWDTDSEYLFQTDFFLSLCDILRLHL